MGCQMTSEEVSPAFEVLKEKGILNIVWVVIPQFKEDVWFIKLPHQETIALELKVVEDCDIVSFGTFLSMLPRKFKEKVAKIGK